ncbi:hypothetical protein [Flavobacterium sp. HNIBRBA15423]|uniref:hypothetical protein n=1 Tax=Flavobacterium sp. HNIBRBA15423 TaxID=3458683 RepID=UPI0040447FC0
MDNKDRNIELTDKLLDTKFKNEHIDNIIKINDIDNYSFFNKKLSSVLKLYYEENKIQKIQINLDKKDYNSVVNDLSIKYGNPIFFMSEELLKNKIETDTMSWSSGKVNINDYEKEKLHEYDILIWKSNVSFIRINKPLSFPNYNNYILIDITRNL